MDRDFLYDLATFIACILIALPAYFLLLLLFGDADTPGLLSDIIP